MSTDPIVTIVVVARERHSLTARSLERIYKNTRRPFRLVYVDSGAPAKWRAYLSRQAAAKGFRLLRCPARAGPNRARNLGLRSVDTKYVILMDNYVLVSPGWLEQLVECAEETNADVVGPLIRQTKVRGDFAIRYHTYLHYSGGDCGVREEHRGNGLCRHLYKETHNHGHVVRPRHGLTRQQVRFTEFHCTLVRSAVFAAIGWLDESIYCEEHVDFCLLVHEAGRTIFFEPGAVVTFVPGPLLEWTDVPVYLRRWSDAWELASYARLREKWDLTESEYFMVRYGRLGLRRREKVIKPLSRWMLPKRGAAVLAKILTVLDSAIHRAHRSYFFWRRGRSLSTSLPAFGLHRYSG